QPIRLFTGHFAERFAACGSASWVAGTGTPFPGSDHGARLCACAGRGHDLDGAADCRQPDRGPRSLSHRPEDSRFVRLRLTLVWLAVLHALIVLAGWVAPYDYAEQHREYPFAPPTPVHFRDTAGGFHFRPFVYGVTTDPAGNYLEDRGHVYPVEFFSG